jgi:hypothetical protein
MRTGQRKSLVRIYRNDEATGTLKSGTTTWTPLGDEWAGFVPAFLTLRNYGAGEQPSGQREMELGSYSSVGMRYGLEVTGGPEAGTRWRVLAVDRSNPKATTVRAEPYNGSFA